jgi:hypothetical protein
MDAAGRASSNLNGVSDRKADIKRVFKMIHELDAVGRFVFTAAAVIYAVLEELDKNLGEPIVLYSPAIIKDPAVLFRATTVLSQESHH